MGCIPLEAAMAKRRVSGEPRDEILVVAAILGDLEAFGELALRYRAAVVRNAAAIVGPDDAEDVAQESLLLAFKALPSIEDPARFPAWLSAITRHRAWRFSRTRKRSPVELDGLLLETIGALATPLLGEKEVAEEVRMALDRIPADYAMVLCLRFDDEMPLKRIAAYLGLPLSTVKWRLHRGKKMLREQVELLRK
jgi:RNA polymerase sigma-70 factor (ECF subfamily)